MILLTGASASGKTEISKILSRDYSIKKAITHTTRKPRVGEVDGIDYHFVDEKEFLRLKEKGLLVEDTFYNGNHYGCSKKEIADDKCVVVDPNGLKSFLLLKNPSIVTFYLQASEKERRERMKTRGDKPMDIEGRIFLDRDSFDIDKIRNVDFVIDTNMDDAPTLAKKIYLLYLETLKKRRL